MTVDVPLSQLRSSQRPTPLRGRDDLVVERMEFQGIVHYVIKDPIGLGYHRLRGEQ